RARARHAPDEIAERGEVRRAAVRETRVERGEHGTLVCLVGREPARLLLRLAQRLAQVVVEARTKVGAVEAHAEQRLREESLLDGGQRRQVQTVSQARQPG